MCWEDVCTLSIKNKARAHNNVAGRDKTILFQTAFNSLKLFESVRSGAALLPKAVKTTTGL